MTETYINLIVALPAEAKPINQHLGLVRDNRHIQYPLYRKGDISLVISGYGAQNSAMATTWLHQTNEFRPDAIWINVGIAGHPSHAVGTSLLANEIVDTTTGNIWVLEVDDMTNLQSERIFTLDQPDTGYSRDGMIDMEAAGFYRSALECTTSDRIHCLKVISDNRDNPTNNLNGRLVSQLIRENLGILDKLIGMENSR